MHPSVDLVRKGPLAYDLPPQVQATDRSLVLFNTTHSQRANQPPRDTEAQGKVAWRSPAAPLVHSTMIMLSWWNVHEDSLIFDANK